MSDDSAPEDAGQTTRVTTRRHPPVRYVDTADGVSIAYWQIGAGPLLLHLPTPSLMHSTRVWDVDAHRRWFDGLAQQRSVIFFDPRGSGLSEGPEDAFQLEHALLDVQAVAGTLEQSAIDLFAISHAAPLALEYARLRPERVRRLALLQPFANWRRWVGDTPLSAIRLLSSGDPHHWATMMSAVFLGSEHSDEDSTQLTRHLEQTQTERPTAFANHIEQSKDWAVRGPLAEVLAPTLVLLRDQIANFPPGAAREVASGVANGSLRHLTGDAFMPYAGDTDAVLREIQEFLDAPIPEETPVVALTLTPRQLEVARLVAHGLSNQQISVELVISPHTVVRHLSRIYATTGMANRAELAARIGTQRDS